MPQSIVIYRLGSIGDAVVALPFLHKIETEFPGYRRVLLTNLPISSVAAPMPSLLEPAGLIDGVIRYPVGLRRPADLWALKAEISELRAETVVYLSGRDRGPVSTYRDYLFLKFCGFRRILGVPLRRSLAEPALDEEGLEEPEVERLARSLGELGEVDLHDRSSWDLRITPAEASAATAFMRSLGTEAALAVNAGGKLSAQHWSDANWRILLEQIGREDVGLLLVGASEERERMQNLAGVWRGTVLNACGVLTPRESAAALGRANAFIGHDSGPMHLAAAMGTPCLGLFGSNNRPRRWHPYGDQHRVIHELRGLDQLAPARVVEAAREFLSSLI